MGWSQDDVIAELALKGVEINHRRLTDWRQKGLLPDMEKARDAHGRVSYVWNQPNIVAQVEAVSELFAYFGRAQRFAHVLWLLGYEVRREVVMEGIRAPIVSLWWFWSNGARLSGRFPRERVLQHISTLATKVTWQRRGRPAEHFGREQAAEVVEGMMLVVVDPKYSPNKLIDEVAARSSAGKANVKNDPASHAKMVQTVRFLQQLLTLRILAEVASTASWEEFVEAGVDFGLLRNIITLFSGAAHNRKEVGDLRPATRTFMRNTVLSGIGPWIIVGDMALRRAGYGRRMRVYLKLIQRQFSRSDAWRSSLDEFGGQEEGEDANA